MNVFDTKLYRKKLDALSSQVLKAYFDSAMFLTIVKLANNKHRTSNFLFDYTYYSIRERAIIVAKSLIEPKGKTKLTIESVIKKLQTCEEYKAFANEMYKDYQELFNSEGSKRVKEFRDSLCHNIENSCTKMMYCKDLMTIINEVMNMLTDIYLTVFNTRNDDFYKIQYISKTLADDYWQAICEQADKMPKRHEELLELQRMIKN